MNLFTISNNTKECVKNLDDVLLRKTIVESAQMLSTAIRMNEKIKEFPEQIYKKYNANEEHNVWVRESKYNFKWTFMYLMDALLEYQYRFGKVHDTFNIAKLLGQYEDYFPLVEMTPFTRKFNQSYDNYNELMEMTDTFKAYKTYLVTKWKFETEKGKAPIWTNREIPEFYKG